MIFVDTSVWVAALRDGASEEANALRRLLDDDEVALPIIVRLEILSGASGRERAELRRLLSAIPVFLPTAATWATVEAWIDRASSAGERFGVADLLIAAIAAEHSGSVWSLDHDFARMGAVGLIAVHVPG